MSEAIKALVRISQYAGTRADYTQGGGGNTSAKDENGNMFIKASGYRLKDIDEKTGYVTVNYVGIKDFLNGVNLDDGKNYDAQNSETIKNCTRITENMPVLRPSVEVGFHAALKTYVIHTHSMYANLITCAVDGEKIAAEIFSGADYEFLFLPYVDPGLTLSVYMKDAIARFIGNNEKFPEVIFMKNHGLVVTGDYVNRVEFLHEDVNKRIRAYFNETGEYNTVALKKTGENKYVSETPLVARYVRENGLTLDDLNAFPLYPDQLVYLNNLLNFNADKLQILNDKAVYNTNLKEALTLEETLFAYLYVRTTLAANNLKISVMSDKDVYFINNWEAEKYRRNLSK